MMTMAISLPIIRTLLRCGLFSSEKTITPHDVAMCMALVKVARLMHAHKKDSYLDLAAYAAIAGEIEARTNKDNQSFESEGEKRGRETAEYIKKGK